MRLSVILLGLLAPLLFAAAIVGVLRIAGRESREEERQPCAFCEFRGYRTCPHRSFA